MSFYEKSAGLMLAALAAGFAWYFWQVWRLAQEGVEHLAPIAVLLIVMNVFVVIIAIIGHALIAIQARLAGDRDVDLRDERDKRIAASAGSLGGFVLLIGAFATIASALTGGSLYWSVQVLVAAIAMSEAVKLAWTIVLYRRGG